MADADIYFPEDAAAIAALQKRINDYDIPAVYTPEQEAQIMKGRRKQADIDAGRQTIQDRIAANKQALQDVGQLSAQLDALKSSASQRKQQSIVNAAATAKANELKTYQNSPLGQTLGIAKTGPAFVGGGLLGGLEAHGLGRLMTGSGEGRVAASPTARMLMGLLAGGAGGLGIYKAHEFADQANDPNQTPVDADAARLSSNFLLGQGLSNALVGGAYSLSDIAKREKPGQTPPPSIASRTNALTAQAQPDIANALAQWQRQPGANALTLQANPQPALPAPEPTPQAPIEPQATAAETTSQSSGLRAPSDRLKAAVASVGGPRNLAKSDAIDFLNDHLGGDNPLRGAIARELGVTNGPNLQQRLLDKLEELKTSRKAYGLLGPAGAMIGAGLALGAGSDDANASPLERAENVAETAAYGLPYVGNALVARDLYRALPSASEQSVVDLADPRAAISPESVQRTYARQNIAAAQAEDARQRNELARTNALNNALSRFAPQGSNIAAVTMAGLPTGAPIPNQLALNGPDGKFYRALQDFQNHFAALKAAGAQANQ